ncbi:MAG: acyltransferase [Ferrovum myxofaciens]|uniref:acyltransferase family protein n=1 Tax=Ferrovum myxofaciens TaxID=416213 RepID=UPI00235333F9|nr:acyltransferase [Ferrovum myxofaciens]QKE41293.1 MAG: acyltransferase [Ferrovum myxofaciens]
MNSSNIITNPDTRFTELDGIRGWASLSVLFYHVFWEIFGVVIPDFRNIFTATIFNGTLSVTVFFVLSGEAISIRFWKRNDARFVQKMALKRYPRLTIPIFFSCLIVYVLMMSHLTYSNEAAVIVNRKDWLGSFLNFTPSFIGLIKHSMLEVYLHHKPSISYNAFLWTMKVEIIGSFAIFILLMIRISDIKKIILAWLIGLILLISEDFTACFLFGMGIGYFRAKGNFVKLVENRNFQIATIPLLLIILIASGIPQLSGVSGQSVYKPLYIIFSVAVVFLAQESIAISNGLKNNLSNFLGKISFPLYLIQFSVFISFTSFEIIYFKTHSGLTLSAVGLIAITTIALSLVLAYFFGIIEKMAHWVSGKLASFMFNQYNKKP